jgi:release factor glutamine methyltransferase
MNNLKAFLDAIGYADLCSSFFPGAPRLEVWRGVGENLTDKRLHRFYSLLLTGDKVAAAEFEPGEIEILEPLIQKNVLIRKHDFLYSNGLSLYMVMGYWLFFETPNVNPKVYYGDDSFGLVSRLRPVRGGATLDLCAGPGVQSLISSAIASRVVSIEINPYAAAIAELNRDINGIDNWEIRVGDLYDALPPDAVFDHVVCNPPLLPFPDDESYPFVGHGGVDGWSVAWRVLDGLPRFLARKGLAQIIGTTLSDGVEPMVLERLSAWAKAEKMDCDLTVIVQKALNRESEYFKGLVYTASAMGDSSESTLSDSYARMLSETDMNALVTHSLSVRHGSGQVKVTDLFNKAVSSGSLWYV